MFTLWLSFFLCILYDEYKKLVFNDIGSEGVSKSLLKAYQINFLVFVHNQCISDH